MRNKFLPKQNSTIHVPKALPILISILAVTGVILWIYLVYYMLYIFKMPKDSDFKGLASTVDIVRRLTFLTISVSGIYILVKATYTRATLYFTLLFTYFSFGAAYQRLLDNGTLPQNWSVVWGGMNAILIIIVIRTFIEFPGRLTSEHIKDVFRRYPMRAFVSVLSWLIPGYRTWLLFIPFGLVFYYVLTPASNVYNLVGICFGLAYLFAQLRIHSIISKKPLYWLLWLIFLNILWGLLLLSAQLFGFQIAHPFKLSVDIALNLSMLFAFVMSVFFSDVLDAKLILQKTVIFGAVIFLITFTFGVTEHFIIHQLAHYFHLQDAYVTSTFACIMGMLFHPLKEKLTHWMNILTSKA